MGISTSDGVDGLLERLSVFRDERAWAALHTIKDLAISISIEAAEVLELTQWRTEEELSSALGDGPLRDRFEDELADVGIYWLLLCQKLGLDPLEAISRKISRNEVRFPKSSGTAP